MVRLLRKINKFDLSVTRRRNSTTISSPRAFISNLLILLTTSSQTRVRLKLVLIVLFCFSDLHAQDDVPVLHVEEISSYGKVLPKEPINFYGKESLFAFQLLPKLPNSPDPTEEPDTLRMLKIENKDWLLSLSCAKYYSVPQSKRGKNDYMCSIWVGNKTKNVLPEKNPVNSRNQIETFNPTGPKDLYVESIDPNGNADGDYVSFYGGSTESFASGLQKNSILIKDKQRTLYIKCEKAAVRGNYLKSSPTTVCSIGIKNNENDQE